MEKSTTDLAKSRNILIACFGFYPETHGVAEVAYRHALGLYQLGYQVTVITRGKSSIKLPFEVVYVERKSHYHQFIRESAAEVIFVHGWSNWASEWIIEILPLRAKVVMISHGTNFNVCLGGWRGILWWLRQRKEAWSFDKKMRLFDHYVFLSSWEDTQRMSDVVWAKKYGTAPFSVIPNGARPAFMVPTHRNFLNEKGIQANRVLLCVSNYEPSKGQRELVQWFCEMKLPNTVLVLIGSTFNRFSDRLKRLVGKEWNQTFFLFEQQTEAEIHAAYSCADVFVTATYTEVQPLMLLDAMAKGLPFLSRKVGVISTLSGGVCFENKASFQLKLYQLLEDDQLRERLGAEGKNVAKKLYHWDVIALKYSQLVCKILDDQL